MSKLSTQTFYDQRGQASMQASQLAIGENIFPVYLREPYSFVSRLINNEFAHKEDRRLLDCCCGTGVHALGFAQMGYQVSGVDFSPDSILAAKKLEACFSLSNSISWLVADISTKLPCKDVFFDILFVSGSLYYFDLPTIFPEIKRVLKSHGLFCAIETNGDNFILNIWRRLKNRFAKHRDERTLTKLLRRRDIEFIKREFPGLKIRYFGCFMLLGACFKRVPLLLRAWCFFARIVDWVLLDALKLRFLAFKFVLYGYNSKAKTGDIQ
ncbi:MAG: hypothetical protein CMF39_04120 [Legionellaceae bacterium]|nr:hypothetical protein [Legionellaceae bacterium]